MVDSEYSTDEYKSSKISIGAIMKNPKMLILIPNHLKTKKMCEHAIKKLLFVIRYNTQQMCNKATLENSGTIESVPY